MTDYNALHCEAAAYARANAAEARVRELEEAIRELDRREGLPLWFKSRPVIERALLAVGLEK